MLDSLKGADRRSVKGVAGAVNRVRRNPVLFRELVRGMAHRDPLVRMRCADAIEKLTRRHPEWLRAHRNRIVGLSASPEQEIRWHMAQVLPRLALKGAGRRRARTILRRYLEDGSRIFRVCSLQALVEFDALDGYSAARTARWVRAFVADAAPSMRARARQLLKSLESGGRV